MQQRLDLFISAGEKSGDLQGAKLIEELLFIRPDLQISAVAGPHMRKLPIHTPFATEDLSVMGFFDVFFSLKRLVHRFFAIRNFILLHRPKAVICLDYPGFHLRLEKNLRKKGYRGKLIHYVCPSVWAWGKKRIDVLTESLDLLLVFFPFEPPCFAHTPLSVQCVGHPLAHPISKFQKKGNFQGKILALFPGSRQAQIARNLPLQLRVARKLQKLDPQLQVAISTPPFPIEGEKIFFVPIEDNYELMQSALFAIATCGTVALELALHQTPTIVTYALRRSDAWIAQHIFGLNLPYYCLPNLLAQRDIFPELIGPHLKETSLFLLAEKFLQSAGLRENCKQGCAQIRELLGEENASKKAAEAILALDF